MFEQTDLTVVGGASADAVLEAASAVSTFMSVSQRLRPTCDARARSFAHTHVKLHTRHCGSVKALRSSKCGLGPCICHNCALGVRRRCEGWNTRWLSGLDLTIFFFFAMVDDDSMLCSIRPCQWSEIRRSPRGCVGCSNLHVLHWIMHAA